MTIPRRSARMAAGVPLALLLGCAGESLSDAHRLQSEIAAGARVITALQCGVCHTIPGIRGARGIVGPSLEGFARRAFIAGTVPNRPSVLVRWVRDAPSIAPDTLMPPLPLSEREAQDVAAYLYTLR